MKRRIFCKLILTSTLSCAVVPAMSQTVTVAKTGSPTFSTIQAAIDNFNSDPDTGAPNIIQITDSAVYDEMITMTAPVEIIGTGSSRPVLAVQANPAGFDNDGLAAPAPTVWAGDAGFLINLPEATTTNSVALRNLIVIPSKTGTPPIAGIVNKANNFYLEMENILVTANDGNDAPITTDGLTDVPANASHIHFQVSGAHLGSITNNRPEGDGVEVRMRDCVFSNIRGTAGDSWRSGFYMYRTYYITPNPPANPEPLRPDAFRLLHVEDGCLFTYNNGNGLRVASGLDLHAPNERTMFVGNTNNGLWMDMQSGINVAEGFISANNDQIGINEGVSTNGPRMNIKDAIIANNGWYGTYHRLGVASQTTSSMERVTIANNSIIHAGTSQIQSSRDTSTVNITMIDTIVTGDGETTKATNVIDLQARGEFTLVNTAIVTEGPLGMFDPPIKLSPNTTQVGTAATAADPDFKNITDPFSPDFYVVQNSAYATLASNGGPLSGGAAFGGVSNVKDWSVY